MEMLCSIFPWNDKCPSPLNCVSIFQFESSARLMVVFLAAQVTPDNDVIVDDDKVPDVGLDARHLITAVSCVDVVGAGVGASCVEDHGQESWGHRDEPCKQSLSL